MGQMPRVPDRRVPKLPSSTLSRSPIATPHQGPSTSSSAFYEGLFEESFEGGKPFGNDYFWPSEGWGDQALPSWPLEPL